MSFLAATPTKIADRLRLVPAEFRLLLGRALAPKAEQRFAFAAAMADALRQTSAPSNHTIANSDSQPSSAITPSELDRTTRALAHYVGPIAAVLVRRAAKNAASAHELWQLLARDFNEAKDREAFLSLRRLG